MKGFEEGIRYRDHLIISFYQTQQRRGLYRNDEISISLI